MRLEAGTHLGPYEIVAPLGAGGMGEVYRAKDTRLDREVAVKVLPEHLSGDPNALTRFEREAKAVAALSHPNILAIHDVGTDPPASPLAKGGQRGVSYVVMELLEGETLRERVRHSAIPWRKAVEYGVAIADGLAAAHAKGIIHRDLKPENIFLTKDGVVKILDFGLARMTPVAGEVPPEKQADTPTMTLDTRPGTVLGTVNYMSPEQISGRATDARTDVFSFGCVLYEMVTGSRAFTGKSVAETTTAILRDEPSPIADSGQVIPVELDREITRCLEKKPEQRIQSARDLAFNLRDLLSNSGPSKPTAPHAGPRMRTMLAVQVAVAVIVVVALLFALNLSGWRDRLFGGGPVVPSGRIDSLAVLPFVNFSGDPDTEYLSDEIPASIINSLSRLSDLRVVPRSTVFRFKGRQEAPNILGHELKVKAVLTGRISVRGDSLTIRAELVDVANDRQLWGDRYNRRFADLLALEEEIATNISEALRHRLTGEEKARLAKRYTENSEAYRAYLQGRYWWNKRSEEGIRKGIEFFNEAIRVDPTYALAYAGKADCYCLLGWYFRPPLEAAPKAKEAIDAAISLDSELPEAYPPLGWVRTVYDWDWPGAERAYKRAIELNPRYPTAHHWYSIYLMAMGRFEEATREIQRAHELDPGSLIINREVGSVRYFRRQFDQAREQLQRTVEMELSFIPAYEVLGRTHLAKHEYDEAIAVFQTMHRLAGHFPRGAGLLGQAYALAGQRERAVEELRSLTGLSSKGLYVPAIAFAAIHGALGNMDEAFEWMDKAVEEREASMPFLKVAPFFDPLRTDPRFDDLLRRIGLEPTRPAGLSPRDDTTDKAPPGDGKIMLAVLPFEDMSPEPQEWFSDGMTEEMIAQLGRLKPERLSVIARTSAMHYRGTAKTAEQIGRELGAGYLVEGSVRRAGESLRITAKLIQVSDQTQLWAEDFDRTTADVLAIQSDVAQRVARALAVELLPSERTRLARVRTVDPEAHEAYLKGRYFWNKRTKEGFYKAIECFERAIEKDAAYAPAHAGLADSYILLAVWGIVPPGEGFPKAKAAALKALQIDDTLAEAHTSLAGVLQAYEWKWAEAEKEFKRAIALNPGYATAHQWYALMLSLLGRHTEAIVEAQRALERDPLSLIIKTDVGSVYYFARQYDKSIVACRETLEMDPSFKTTYANLAGAYAQKGMYAQAISEAERAVELSNAATYYVAWLGHIYAVAGKDEQARTVLNGLIETSRRTYVLPSSVAMIYADLGESDQAFEWLEKAYAQRDIYLGFIKVQPFYDSLRGDPRFDDLLRRIGLDPSAYPKPQTAKPPSGKIRLAVLPFDNLSNDPEQEYFVDGMTDEMITTLGRVRPHKLRVIGRTSAMRYKNSSKALDQIGSELNVGYLVDGSVRRSGNTVRISAQLLQVSDQTQLWGNSYTRDLSDVFAIQAEVAQAVAKALAVELLPGKRGMPAKIPTTISAAHDAYLRGRHFEGTWTSDGLRKAIDHYEQAIEHDPDYALAYAGLAESYTRLAWYSDVRPMEAFPAAKEAVAKALELDDTLAAAHAAMGMCYMLHDWDWPAAGKALRRAIGLDPGFAMGHQEYALFLETTGQIEKALEQMKTALELDPLSLHKNVNFGWMLTQAGEYDRAIVQLKETVALAPSFAFVRGPLGFAYLGKGMHDEAIQTLQEGTHLSGGHPLYRASLGFVYAKAGNEERAREVLQDVLRQADERYVRAGDIACIYAALGQDDEAFEWLERAYQEREPQLAWLKVDRRWDGVRDDARFSELLRRIGLEVPVPATNGSSSVPQKERTRLAVLPFERMSTDPDTDYLSEEIPASIIDSLSNLSELHVIPRSTAFRCKIGDRDIASIGRDLNATAVLTGQINTRAGGLRIRAELVDVATNRQLWSERYDRTLTDILAIERDITDRLSEALKVRLTGEDRTQLAQRSTENAQAHRAYLEGRFWWNRRTREGHNKAIELFDEAIRLDPDFALAYAGKADCYCLMVLLDSLPKECIPKAREATEQALAANGTLAEAHTSLGWIKWVYDWDSPGAERSFKRAIELNPRYPTAYNWYAAFLASIGRDEEALEQISRAHQLDPGSLIINRDLGVIYSWTGQFDRAIDQLRRTVQMDPLFAPAHAHLGRVYGDAGMYEEAIAETEIAADLAGGVTHAGQLGYAYARVGRRDDAMRELEKLTEFSKQRDVPAFKFALIHAGLGDNDQAFEWLEKAHENREFPMAILQVAETLDSLRDDPRFADLLRRIGLSP